MTGNLEYLVLDERMLQRLRRRYPRTAATVFYNLTRIWSDRLQSTTDALAAGGVGPVAPMAILPAAGPPPSRVDA